MSVTRITECKSLNTDEQKTQYEKNYSDNNVADIRKVMKDFKQSNQILPTVFKKERVTKNNYLSENTKTNEFKRAMNKLFKK